MHSTLSPAEKVRLYLATDLLHISSFFPGISLSLMCLTCVTIIYRSCSTSFSIYIQNAHTGTN
jgi:hypothetical protein